MTPGAATTSTPALAAVAGYGIGRRLDLPDRPLGDAAWDELLAGVVDQRLAGFLANAIRDGAFAATEQQAKTIHALHLHGLALTMRLERQLLTISETFGQREIPVRLMKGLSVANRFYPDPAARLFCDLDLLVPGERFDDAARAMLALGASRHYPEPRPGFDRRFSKGASFTTADGLEVDLHRTLVLGPFGLTVDLPSLFAESPTVRIADRDVSVMDTDAAFVHVAMHAALGDSPPRLTPLRDIAQIAFDARFDTQRALAVARAWRVEAPVAFAVRTAATTFDLPDHPVIGWAHNHRADHRQARALALYLGPRRSSQSLALAAVRFVPGIRGKAAYLTSLALPNSGYLATREGTYKGRLRHAVELVRDLRVRNAANRCPRD